MLKVLLTFLVLIARIQACAPGSGTLGTVGTFAFEMIPPTSYTYSSTGIVGYGQISKDFATREIDSDVQNSINEVLQANNIPLNDVSPPVITFTPPDVQLNDYSVCNADTIGQYITYDHKVYYQCGKEVNGQYPKTAYSTPLTVKITAVLAIYQSQWDVLASQVADKLTAKRSAAFLADPIVTVTN